MIRALSKEYLGAFIARREWSEEEEEREFLIFRVFRAAVERKRGTIAGVWF